MNNSISVVKNWLKLPQPEGPGIVDVNTINFLINDYCNVNGFKLPYSMRKSGKPKKPGQIERLKCDFIRKYPNMFVDYVNQYIANMTEIKGNSPANLLNSLITI